MDSAETPGPMMRRLRKERNLTLRAAANALDMSASALSRLEREVRQMERHDIEAVIPGYGLTQWEGIHLWLCAGFSPPQPPGAEGQADWATVVDLLRGLNLPAYVVDEFNYILAWNGEMHALWQMTATPLTPVHALDQLFTPLARAQLGIGWADAASVACWQYYVKTLHLAGDARYLRTLRDLADKYGADFIAIWNQAVATGLSGGWAKKLRANIVLTVETPVGAADYLILQNVTHAILAIEVIVHVPLGAQSIERNARLMKDVEPGRIVRCPRPGRSAAGTAADKPN